MMKCEVIDGEELAKIWQSDIRKKAEKFSRLNDRPPGLATILVGEDKASASYVRAKHKAAAKVGIDTTANELSSKCTEEQLFRKISELNEEPSVDAILLQLPIPKHIDSVVALNSISIVKDVDGLHPYNQGQLQAGSPQVIPPTPRACLELIKHVHSDLRGLDIVIVGRSALVGRPLAALLLNYDCTVTLCHSETKQLAKHCRTAEVIISAAGVPNLITAEHVSSGAVVIDVGINRNAEGNICGDVAFDEVSEVASALTPVPGGVGPMTVSALLANVVDLAHLNNTQAKKET